MGCYSIFNTLTIDCGHDTDWPDGVYSLPMSVYGCPGAIKCRWRHERMDIRARAKYASSVQHVWSDNFHLLGPIDKKSVRINKCVWEKNNESHSQYKWPEGGYCILGANDSCPQGKRE